MKKKPVTITIEVPEKPKAAGRKIIIFDTETTDLVKPGLVKLELQPRIVEFAAIALDFETMVEAAHVSFRCNPGVPIPAESSAITKIYDKDVANELPFSSRLSDVSSIFLGADTLVGHNIDFDTQMLMFELMRSGMVKRFPWPQKHICTVQASSQLSKKWLKLEELYAMATGKPLVGAHGALADARATAVSLRWLVAKKHLKLS